MSRTRYYTKDNNNNTGNREDFASHGVGPNSPDSTSSIIDLHDLEQQQNKDMVLDDSAYDFFVEAGLENPSEWSMLGVDMEDLRKQRIITQRRQLLAHHPHQKRKFEGEVPLNTKRLKPGPLDHKENIHPDSLHTEVFHDTSESLRTATAEAAGLDIDTTVSNHSASDIHQITEFEVYYNFQFEESNQSPIIDLFNEAIFSDSDDYDSDYLGAASASLQTTIEPVTATEPETTEFENTEPHS
ncbi:hypothetical protein BD770DRAFT_445761 [Pilaira anomala]|nr:hypothetical protein BD770DRAFT_445761 [Pilaira anomala]